MFFVSKLDTRHKNKIYTKPASTRAFKAFMSTAPAAAVLGRVIPEVKAAIASGVVATVASVDILKRSFSSLVLVVDTLTHQRASSKISGWSGSNTGCLEVVTARIFRLGYRWSQKQEMQQMTSKKHTITKYTYTKKMPQNIIKQLYTFKPNF